MKADCKGKGCLLLPGRRKLMSITLSYLAGIYLSARVAVAVREALLACTMLAIWIVLRRRAGRRVFFLCVILAALLGNAAAGRELARRDEATAAGTLISGTVIAIESDYRVMLSSVALPDGKTTQRPIVVTLMLDENQMLPARPKVGQQVHGTGRLFAQEEARNPGGIDGRVSAICKGYELSGYLLPGWTAEGEERCSAKEGFRQLRLYLVGKLEVLFGDYAPLFTAVMLGVRRELDAELTAAMRLTGTAHLLTVSGMHLTMLSGAIAAILRALKVRGKTAAFVQAALLSFFTLLTGCAVGTVRALIMALLRLLAPLRGRKYEPLTALSLAALLLSIHQPLLAFDGSFQFSFFVVLGILLISRAFAGMRVGRMLEARFPKAAAALFVSVSAQIAAVPMNLALYGYVPLLSLPLNLVCGAATALLLIGGWGTLIVSFLHAGAGAFCADGLSLVSMGFEQMSVAASGWEYAILRLPSPYRVSLILFALLMALLSPQIRFGSRRKAAAMMTAALLALGYLPRLNPAARLVQLDVGQGDASLIRIGRSAVVVDVGPADSYDLLRYLRHEGLFVEAVILSHPDEDHAGALKMLLNSEVKMNRVIMAERAQGEAASLAVIEGLVKLEGSGAEIETVSAGDTILAGGVELSVLSPDETLSGSNERSLLLHTEVEGTTMLFTGDLPVRNEPAIAPACDILKVAHHGSQYASSREFIAQVSPRIAIISVGADNRYGHPHERVLGDLEAVGAKIYRTDESGCIVVWLGEGGCEIKTMFD